MNLAIFASMLFGLQIFYWFIGRRASRNLKNTDDYILAGKSVGFLPLMMTFLATQVGGGLVLGSAEEAYKFGWPAIFFPLGSALGLILLGAFTGKPLASFKVSTVAQLFEVVYKSPVIKRLASTLSIISLFMLLVAQVIASHKFLASLGMTSDLLFIAFWAIVIIYTVQGGLRAVISTDFVQAAFFTICFFLCFGLIFPQAPIVMLPKIQEFALVSSKLSGWLLMPLLFMAIEQDMAQRCFAAKSPKIVSSASIVAGLVTFVLSVVPIFLAIAAKNMNLAIPEGSSVLMTVISQLTNPWVAALLGCAILAAVISTATSLISAISSNLSSDFTLLKNASIRKVQALTGGLCVIAIVCAFYLTNIVDVMVQSYELSVACLFVPIIFAFYKKEGYFQSALMSIIFGAIGFCFFRFLDLSFPKEIASVLFSLLGYGIGEAVAQYRRKKLLWPESS